MVNKREFAGSGLTVAAHRGADYVGADKVGERIAAAVAASAERPSLTYLYDGDLDWTGHRYGVASSQWLQQLSMVDAEAEQLREALPAGRAARSSSPTTAWSTRRRESRIDVDEHLDLRAGVALLGGEARFRHLYCRGGAVDDVVATWTELLGDRADGDDPRRRDRARLVRRRRRRRCCRGSATSSSPATVTPRSCRARTSPTRRRWSACTARSRPTRC